MLLVDDSDAVIAFHRAVLSSDYPISVARDGRQALEQLERELPGVVVLDLSMPVLDGEAVLTVVQASDRLSQVPVIVVSTEEERGLRCLERGATAFLRKPVSADALKRTVAQVLEEARAARTGPAVLRVEVGGAALLLPLASIERVLARPTTRPLPGGPPWMDQVLVLEGQVLPLLELAARLDLTPRAPLVDQWVVVIAVDGARVGVVVDVVADPIELAPERVTPVARLAAGAYADVREALRAVVVTEAGPLGLVEPRALVTPELLELLPALLRALSEDEG